MYCYLDYSGQNWCSWPMIQLFNCYIPHLYPELLLWFVYDILHGILAYIYMLVQSFHKQLKCSNLVSHIISLYLSPETTQFARIKENKYLK